MTPPNSDQTYSRHAALTARGGPGFGRVAPSHAVRGEWDHPPGKLAVLFELERIATLLRDGGDPLDPDRDRRAFTPT